jgi:hypothetical protein
LASSEALLESIASRESGKENRDPGAWIATALTVPALAIHGYHPYAEDGGVYLAGVKHVLDPGLYPAWTGFVFTIWLTLYAAWHLARRCTANTSARVGAVLLLALLLTIPVAGTSLMLVDPYVTARSITTPLVMFALAFTLDMVRQVRQEWRLRSKSFVACGVCLLFAALIHPLMAAYGLGCVIILACFGIADSRIRAAAVGGLSALAIALAGTLEGIWPAAAPDYVKVAETRNYWFLSTWHWYELLGLIAPLAVLLASQKSTRNLAARSLALMAAVAGSAAVAVALLFARETARALLVARLQPLRIFQIIYVLMILALGSLLGERILKSRLWAWAALIAAAGGGMYLAQRDTFPHSSHIEFPGRQAANQWVQGFLWIRNHTPREARFAMDSHYVAAPGEDSQNFRAIAERSAMPDYSKDGGITSIAPYLTEQWSRAQAAQNNLGNLIDPQRVHLLRALGAQWLVLAAGQAANLECPYANASMKVCELGTERSMAVAMKK